jgi:cytoskeletal protein CcmA (bactofilin family)
VVVKHRAAFFGIALFAFIGLASPLLASLVTTNIFVVAEDDPIMEDVYVTSQSAVVDGVIDGDLVVFSGNITINGEVTGDVIAFSSATVRVNEGGRVGGALRGAAVNVSISGSVGSDVFVSAASVVLEEPGVVARDLMAFGGVLRAEGTVGRDIRGRTMRTVVDGVVVGDIDIASQKFEVGQDATVDGDILYRSAVEADIDASATVAGTITRLPAQSNFVYGIILSLANVVGFLGFVVAGLVALLVLRGSGARATGAVLAKPIRSTFYGLAALIGAPIVIVVLAATLVGLPLAIIAVCLVVAAFVVGPVPAVAALGNRVLLRRGGLFGAFVVGAMLWRFGIWVVPVVGGVLYLIVLVIGTGAWIVGFIETRRGSAYPVALLPASMISSGGVPDDWVPPRAPVFDSDPELPGEDEPEVDAGTDGAQLAVTQGTNDDTSEAAGSPRTDELAAETTAQRLARFEEELSAIRDADASSVADSDDNRDGRSSEGSQDDWGLPTA